MSKDRLLSDEELNVVISDITSDWSVEHNTTVLRDRLEANKKHLSRMRDLINTQKKLYAENEKLRELNRVRIEAIGNSRENLLERIVQRMEFCKEELGLRAEQRASIYKQNADDFRRIK